MKNCLKNANEAAIPVQALGVILVFIVIGIIILAVVSLVFGIFTLIGACMLIGSAFILYMKKGAVTIAPNSVFMWLLIIGLILICFGQFVMDIGTIDLRTIPGLEALHDLVRVNEGGLI